MNDFNDTYSVYAILDGDYIVAIDSSYQITPTEDDNWIKIDEGTGIKYALAGTNYIDDIPLQTSGGAYKYKLNNGKLVKCDADDIKEQETRWYERERKHREAMIDLNELIDGYADHEYRLCMLELFGEEGI